MMRMTGMTQPASSVSHSGRPLAFEADLLRLQFLDELGIVDLDGDEVLGRVVRDLDTSRESCSGPMTTWLTRPCLTQILERRVLAAARRC